MKKLLFISTLVLGLGVTSCDSFLDINENPNSPAESALDAGMLMPAAEMNLAVGYGDYLRITGGYFSEIYAHLFGTGNYIDYSQFSQSATRCSSTYSQFYQRVLNTLKTITEKATAKEDWGTCLAAATLRAFTLQAIVDCWGEAPYSEALIESILSPKYDDGLTIYEGILAELDAALDKANEMDDVCTNFLYPNQTAGSWIKFANAVKLRILMRMSNVKDVKNELTALIQADKFPTSDVQFAGCWSEDSNKRNPFYMEEFQEGVQNNICANLTIIGTMQTSDYTDPRLAAYFMPNGAGKYVGGLSGTKYPGASSLNDWCRPVASAKMPLVLYTVAETEFFKSEYYARYGSASDAATHYAAAIAASFASAGVEGADEYLAVYPFDASNYKKTLGIAKWVHLSGVNTFEAWCELRRLRYPAFGSKQGDDFYPGEKESSFDTSSYEPGTLYTPIHVFAQVGANKILERFPYAESSSSRNENVPEFPGYTAPVFWAK